MSLLSGEIAVLLMILLIATHFFLVWSIVCCLSHWCTLVTPFHELTAIWQTHCIKWGPWSPKRCWGFGGWTLSQNLPLFTNDLPGFALICDFSLFQLIFGYLYDFALM